MLNDHALDEAGSGGIFLASLNVFKWQLSCVLISIELFVLVVAPHADDKNVLLQMREFDMAMIVWIFLCVLFSLCFNYVWETSSPYSLSLLAFRGNTQFDHFSIKKVLAT